MCILFYTITQPGFKLILASNRDEYFDRPALPAQWHTFQDHLESGGQPRSKEGISREPWVLSGRDIGSPFAGTWLGMTRDLRVGIITNVRAPLMSPEPRKATAPSRGLLLKRFLSPPLSNNLPSIQEYLTDHMAQANEYDGFNLLLLKLGVSRDSEQPPEVGYLGNRPSPILHEIGSSSTGQGVASQYKNCYGLSNTPLSEPWPKVIEGERRMSESLSEWARTGADDDNLVKRMMELLQQSIPLTSLADAARCTCLQPVLVGKNPAVPLADKSEGRWYGTRVSTVILVKDNGEVTFVERDVGEIDGQGGAKKGKGERRFTFEAHG